jgi:hypothetical protein
MPAEATGATGGAGKAAKGAVKGEAGPVDRRAPAGAQGTQK